MAFLSHAEGVLSVEVYDAGEREAIEKALSFLETRNPDLRVVFMEKASSEVAIREVGSNEPEYLDSIAGELSSQGWICHIVPVAARDVLLALSQPKISLDERKDVLGDIVNLPEKEAVLFKEYLDKLRK